MHAFLTDVDLAPFLFSLIILVILSMVETIGYYFKIRPSKLFTHLFPKQITDSPLINVKFSKLLIFIFLLLNFSVAGYYIQFFIYAKQGAFAPSYYVIIPALITSVFFTVFMIHCLDQVIKPKVNNPNISLIGRLATISSGNARPGFSAQARVRDEFGQVHYVQVEPEFGELEFQAQIILIRQSNSLYIAKKISHANNLLYKADQI
jgi:hypothetical protein